MCLFRIFSMWSLMFGVPLIGVPLSGGYSDESLHIEWDNE